MNQPFHMETEPKSLDKFIINFDNNELDIVSGSFCLNFLLQELTKFLVVPEKNNLGYLHIIFIKKNPFENNSQTDF